MISVEVKYRKLRAAVRRWIRAEYAFRLGPNAYHKPTDDWIIAAEDRLRKVATGKRRLENAAKKIGVKVRGVKRLKQKPRG